MSRSKNGQEGGTKFFTYPDHFSVLIINEKLMTPSISFIDDPDRLPHADHDVLLRAPPLILSISKTTKTQPTFRHSIQS